MVMMMGRGRWWLYLRWAIGEREEVASLIQIMDDANKKDTQVRKKPAPEEEKKMRE